MRTPPTPLLALSVVRSLTGGLSWASPKASWRALGLGPLREPGSAGAAARLFGVRDHALGLALHHPSAVVHRAVVRGGVAIDTVDVAAALLAVRTGAPRTSLAGLAAGAAQFAGLGAAALAGSKL